LLAQIEAELADVKFSAVEKWRLRQRAGLVRELLTGAYHLRRRDLDRGLRLGRSSGDKAAPLIGSDLPELERPLPAIRPDCTGADTGVVEKNIDAAEPITSRLSDLLGRGIVGQIRLDCEEVGSLALLTRARRKRFQRLSIAIDTGDPDARR
jgi:hypothetical protein